MLEERVLLTAPTGVDDFYTANDDKLDTTAESLDSVLANDTDPENDPLTASLLTGPDHGSLTLNSNGSFVYQPDTDFVGEDTFIYEVSDGSETDMATVTITVTKPFGDRADASEPGVDSFSNEGSSGRRG